MNAHNRSSSGRHWLRVAQRLIAITLLAVLTAGWTVAASAATRAEPHPESLVRLPGHVLDALERATPAPASPADQVGFDRYLHDVYDPDSPKFRHFLSQSQIATRFGPTRKTYNDVLAYFQQRGFTLVQGSANRLTLTMRGTRAHAERALSLAIRDYQVGSRGFYANDRDPELPANISRDIQAIAGLTNAGAPAAPLNQPVPILNDACDLLTGFSIASAPGVLWMSIEGGAGLGGVLFDFYSFIFLPNLSIAAAGPVGGAVLFIGGLVSTYCAAYAFGQTFIRPSLTSAATIKKSPTGGPVPHALTRAMSRTGLLWRVPRRPSQAASPKLP
ncbi:MAG: hypothetical protein E6H55_15010 [Betaproteobacteria bacterium]|nr:MAG: hypothetical protein E6H55_15010 [Betaproteobacteria bacterium]